MVQKSSNVSNLLSMGQNKYYINNFFLSCNMSSMIPQMIKWEKVIFGTTDV